MTCHAMSMAGRCSFAGRLEATPTPTSAKTRASLQRGGCVEFLHTRRPPVSRVAEMQKPESGSDLIIV